MDNHVKHREWVKNAAIVFLLVLLVLTFFSNTIMNRSLPEVATQRIDSGTITAKVRGTGKVESQGMYEVKAETSREIRTVLVKAGQEVKAGDVLFLLGDGTSQEVEDATEKLRSLELAYEKTRISGSYSDYTLLEYQVAKAEQDLEDAVAARDAAYEKLLTVGTTDLQPDVLKNQIKALQAKSDYWADQEELAAIEYNWKIEELENALAAASEEEREAAEQALEDFMSEPYAPLVKAQEQLKAVTDELERIQGMAGPYFDAYTAAEMKVDEKTAALLSAQSSLRSQQIADGRANAALSLELKDLKEQIEKAKENLAKLTGDEDDAITARVSGTVSEIYFTAGNTPGKDSVLCTIDVPDLGYTLSFSCTNDQARRLHVGDSATVSNYYWGSTITATLSSIQTDPKNPQTSKLLTFDVTGDVTTGSDLTISVGSKSATYDVIIPNNAIRRDSNGTYVLLIEAKNSALGNRYFARRVTVEVLAEDDLNSAVTGDLNPGDFVLTTSSVPVKSGDQIRIKES